MSTTSESPHYRPTPEARNSAVVEVVEADRKRIEIKPSGLDVTWGNDSRYWEIPKNNKDGPITLSQVSWLEVTGNFKMDQTANLKSKLEKNSKYKVTFKMSLKQDAFGWNGCPVYLMVKKPTDGKYVWKSADLSGLSKDEGKPDYVPSNGTLVFGIGEVLPDTLSFGLYEIWRGRWKGGLRIHGVVIEKV